MVKTHIKIITRVRIINKTRGDRVELDKTNIITDDGLSYYADRSLDNSTNFESVHLGFDEGILQLIELHDSLGQITIITMTNIRNNPVVDMKLFIYQENPDFDLIDSRKKRPTGD